jgi:hypothetical protein
MFVSFWRFWRFWRFPVVDLKLGYKQGCCYYYQVGLWGCINFGTGDSIVGNESGFDKKRTKRNEKNRSKKNQKLLKIAKWG